jgi:hypothetical protein
VTTDAELLLRQFAKSPKDETLHAALLDCLVADGHEVAQCLIQTTESLRTENLDCEMFMYSCDEFSDTFSSLYKNGCAHCSRYASLKLFEAELWALLVTEAALVQEVAQ